MRTYRSTKVFTVTSPTHHDRPTLTGETVLKNFRIDMTGSPEIKMASEGSSTGAEEDGSKDTDCERLGPHITSLSLLWATDSNRNFRSFASLLSVLLELAIPGQHARGYRPDRGLPSSDLGQRKSRFPGETGDGSRCRFVGLAFPIESFSLKTDRLRSRYHQQDRGF